MKPEIHFIYKMLKMFRFFRRERRSVDVTETKDVEKGLTLFQYSAFYCNFQCVYIFHLSLLDVYNVRVMFDAFFYSENDVFMFNLFYS